jgi:hypothetical protein
VPSSDATKAEGSQHPQPVHSLNLTANSQPDWAIRSTAVVLGHRSPAAAFRLLAKDCYQARERKCQESRLAARRQAASVADENSSAAARYSDRPGRKCYHPTNSSNGSATLIRYSNARRQSVPVARSNRPVRCILQWPRAKSVVRACLPFSPIEGFLARRTRSREQFRLQIGSPAMNLANNRDFFASLPRR